MPALAAEAPSATTLVLCVAGAFICHKLVFLYQDIKQLGFLPGKIVFFDHESLLSNYVLPAIPGIALGKHFEYENKYSDFEQVGCSVYRISSLWPRTRSALFVADADAVKEVTSSGSRFPKPLELYELLAIFGRNIVVSEGDEWKKYRKIAAPAFSEKNNKLVWAETINIMEGLFNDMWEGKDVITVDHCVDITLPLALFVIGAAGFGKRMTWGDSETPANGHQLSFKEALHGAASDTPIKVAVPTWAMGLTKRTRRVRLAFDELERYMSEMIYERLHEGKGELGDLFSNLVESNSLDSGPNSLTERELASNIFIFLLAGHETTAHTLCFALACLALYQEEQEKLYNHVKSVLPDGRTPTYEDRTKLTHCLAVMYETMRLIPPGLNIPKYSAEDTTLTATNAAGEKVIIPVPKGTQISLIPPALHTNPQYWEDPHTFNYERFLRDYNRDAFLPFSSGPRSCIGRKFSETEAIAALAMFTTHFKVTVKEEAQFANESFEERKARVLKCKPGISVTPVRVPLVFTRRT